MVNLSAVLLLLLPTEESLVVPSLSTPPYSKELLLLRASHVLVKSQWQITDFVSLVNYAASLKRTFKVFSASEKEEEKFELTLRLRRRANNCSPLLQGELLIR